MIIARDIHLWRQDPVKTEERCYWELLSLFEKRGDVLYLAYPWATYLNNLAPMMAPWIPEGQSEEVFTVCQHVRFRELIPLLKSVGVTTLFTPHATLSEPEIEGIQVLGLPHWPAIEDVERNFLDEERKYLYSFIGEANHPLRTALAEMVSPDGLILLREQWHFEITKEEKTANAKEYLESIHHSEFVLCPRGVGPSSLRIWEVFSAGGIPVIIADDLRLPEGRNWDRCMVKVKEDQISELPAILNSISESRRKMLRENSARIGNLLRVNFSFPITERLIQKKFPIWMKPQEVLLISRYLSEEHEMLEWGSGGSTVRFPFLTESYVSIEHDIEWFERINAVAKDVELFYVDLDCYVDFPSSLRRKFDRVFIDGRRRVECAEALIRFDLLKDDAIVFLHDWCRERYRDVLQWFEIVEKIESKEKDQNGLAVLRRKSWIGRC